MRLHVAAVYTTAGIRVLTAARTEDEIDLRVAGHVRLNADHGLWPADARQVRELLDRGHLKEAIGIYFSRVGDRWDREFLHTEVIDLDVEPPETPLALSGLRGNGTF